MTSLILLQVIPIPCRARRDGGDPPAHLQASSTTHTALPPRVTIHFHRALFVGVCLGAIGMPTMLSICIFPALTESTSWHIQHLPRSQVRNCFRTPGTPFLSSKISLSDLTLRLLTVVRSQYSPRATRSQWCSSTFACFRLSSVMPFLSPCPGSSPKAPSSVGF